MNPENNLGTLLSTSCVSRDIFSRYLGYNHINKNEYPECQDAEKFCISYLKDLWNGKDIVGTATSGSSEACNIALLSAIEWARSLDKSLTIFIDSGAHSVWSKLSKIYNLKTPIYVYETPDQIVPLCIRDNINCVFIVCTVGTTVLGSITNPSDIDSKLFKESKISLFVHVDAAVGGFVLPFINYEGVWDFRCDSVKSINTSGHKYGGVYPGLGWLLIKKGFEAASLYEEFDYLNGEGSNYGFNFSRSSAHIMAQEHILKSDILKSQINMLLSAKRYFEDYIRSTKELELVEVNDFIPTIKFKIIGATDKYSKRVSENLLKYFKVSIPYCTESNVSCFKIVCRIDTATYKQKIIDSINKLIQTYYIND